MVRATARLLVSAGGAAFVVAAIFCDAAWFERHIALPCFYPAPPSWLHGVIRAGLAAVGLLLLAGAGPLCRRGTPAGVARVGIALVLALCASEWILRRFGLTARAVRAKRAEHILGGADARYGWVLLPSRTTLLGPPVRPVPYSIDAWGNRAATDARSPDPAKPSLVVAGESTAFGYGLEYEQTFAALLGRDLGLQVVNVAVGGYATDQAALRLEDTLDKLERPVAVVQVFLLVQLQRNVQDYRPRLVLRDGALALAPRASGPIADLRVRDLVVNETPVLFEWQLRDSLAVTRAVLREAHERIRARGAAALFLVVSFGAPAEAEEQLVRTLFSESGLPFARVQVDFAHLLPHDHHPDAEASRTLAAVAASALRAQIASRAAPATPRRTHQGP